MAATNVPSVPRLPLSQSQLDDINRYLSKSEPQQILQWGLEHLPSLYQSTAFGLTGLAATDMLSKLSDNPPRLIFIDTLHHFDETLELKNDVERRYNTSVIVVKPDGAENADEFAKKYGDRLWETNDLFYDYLVKVEPAQRIYKQLGVKSIITGRRASQGGSRSTLQPLEVDATGLLKLNPFYSWSFTQVKAYIDEKNVPVNKLLSQGYRSIGDWHSTVKSGDGDAGERAGRWNGKNKTECGLHVDYYELKGKLGLKE
ncbi:hypothetical protein FRC02_000962, partial [Tulasnella sp. 418]